MIENAKITKFEGETNLDRIIIEDPDDPFQDIYVEPDMVIFSGDVDKPLHNLSALLKQTDDPMA